MVYEWISRVCEHLEIIRKIVCMLYILEGESNHKDKQGVFNLLKDGLLSSL